MCPSLDTDNCKQGSHASTASYSDLSVREARTVRFPPSFDLLVSAFIVRSYLHTLDPYAFSIHIGEFYLTRSGLAIVMLPRPEAIHSARAWISEPFDASFMDRLNLS